MFRLSWAIALMFSLAMLTGILIVTRDLSVTNNIFKDGVVQAEKVSSTTDTAVNASGQLPPADQAIQQGFPQVVGVLGSLTRAETTLGSLGSQLGQLAAVLRSADPPLVGIISAASNSTVQAGAAVKPVAAINVLLGQANQKIRALGPLLDQTIANASDVQSKLHILLLIPSTSGN
jgi:hypothetical protein